MNDEEGNRSLIIHVGIKILQYPHSFKYLNFITSSSVILTSFIPNFEILYLIFLSISQPRGCTSTVLQKYRNLNLFGSTFAQLHVTIEDVINSTYHTSYWDNHVHIQLSVAAPTKHSYYRIHLLTFTLIQLLFKVYSVHNKQKQKIQPLLRGVHLNQLLVFSVIPYIHLQVKL